MIWKLGMLIFMNINAMDLEELHKYHSIDSIESDVAVNVIWYGF